MDDLNTTETTPYEQPLRRRRSKKFLIVLCVILLLVGGGYALKRFGKTDLIKPSTATKQGPEILNIPPAEVTITSRGLVPQTVKIKKGQAIAWTNKDYVVHQLASNPYPPVGATFGFTAQGASRPTEMFLYTFFQTGTFTYYDRLHPGTYQGTIIVE